MNSVTTGMICLVHHAACYGNGRLYAHFYSIALLYIQTSKLRAVSHYRKGCRVTERIGTT